jgi:hypothetical protein
MEVTGHKGSSGDLQHFADRIIAERGIRHGRVAMIPTSAKTKRKSAVETISPKFSVISLLAPMTSTRVWNVWPASLLKPPSVTLRAIASRPFAVRGAFLGNTEASQGQLLRFGPDGQPTESSDGGKKYRPCSIGGPPYDG